MDVIYNQNGLKKTKTRLIKNAVSDPKKQRSQVTLLTTGGNSTKHVFPSFMWTNKRR